MTDIRHPSAPLNPEWTAIIRANAMAAEQAGLLQPAQLALIYEQQWFKLLVPKIYGGVEMPLPDLVRLEEALAWADGSLGWVITLCAGAGWFGGFLEPALAGQVFADPKVCLAGSGANTGTAERTANGYRINGSWKYASGVKHATHFTCNCTITQNGETVLNTDGSPVILPFVIDRKDVTLIPAWKYIGMMGTGSHAFRVDNLEVDADRCFKIEPKATVVDTPLYQYPFLQLAETTLAANLSGMAIHFVDLCGQVFEAKLKQDRLTTPQRITLMYELDEAKTKLQATRNGFYAALDASWSNMTDITSLQTVSQTSRELAKTARETVDKLYPYCGLLAATPDTEINQVWRDLHTASQHALLTFLE